MISDHIKEILNQIIKLKNKISNDEIKDILNKYQENSAEFNVIQLENLIIKHYLTPVERSPEIFLEIHSGTGGDDARELAEMLFNSYIEFLKPYKVQIIEPGKESGSSGIGTGILRATIPFYKLIGEHGIHRIVREHNGKRQTSFISVTLIPFVQKRTVQILDKDLEVKTCKSSGAGGQHVNKTESAVMVTHKPSGITVKCQSEKSQHTNRQIAIDIISSKLEQRYQIELEKSKNVNSKLDISWGNHFRNYCLYAPKLIQDNRVNIKIMSHKLIDNVLYKGGFDIFITPYLLVHFLNIIKS